MSAVGQGTKEENERQYDVIGQMLTMHASLRDRLARRALCLNIAVFTASLFLAVCAFADDEILEVLRINARALRLCFGFGSVVVLVCSVVEFRVDWRSLSGRHAEAARRLSQIKAKYRTAFAKTHTQDERRNVALTREYNRVMRSLPEIPERWFIPLKAEHRFKRLLSNRITDHPKTPSWVLRWQLRLEGLSEALSSWRTKR